jgi:3-phosphoshikimate 1-carboxyvinyltransferase
MKSFSIRSSSGSLKGIVALSGDKSIAHRALIVSALAPARTTIENFPSNEDCTATLNAVTGLGIPIKRGAQGRVTVSGKGLFGLKKPKKEIFAGESGTTFRLLLGVLAGQNFTAKLAAAASLSQRPMMRITAPLRMMGAHISSRRGQRAGRPEEYPPITITGGNLNAITYTLPVASAQVKSAILLAGLYAPGATRVIESVKTRDHTERMLSLFGADIKRTANKIVIKGGMELSAPGRIYVPADFSSASFFMVGASIIPGSRVTLRNVGLNPTRTGALSVLMRMGAFIRVSSCRGSKDEPIGDVKVMSARLRGTVVRRKEIPSLIDELPILMVAACFARGKTVFEGAGELRVKETDRIKSMTENLARMGARIKVQRCENIIIEGAGGLSGRNVRSFGDHRTAMSMVIAGLAASGETTVDDVTCIKKSFPQFLAVLRELFI